MLETPFALTDPLLPTPLIASLQDWIEEESGGAAVTRVSSARHSNDVAELRLDDGRRMMVKRGRYEWVAERFENARAASAMLRDRVGISVPEPLDLPPEMDDRPLEAYWRIDHPTLSQVWGDLDTDARRRALASWGLMLTRVHGVPLSGWGPLRGGLTHASIQTYLGADLYERLIPSVWCEWRDALQLVEDLALRLPALAERVGERTAVMVHGDVHMGNILCEPGTGGPTCVGMLDLECAVASLEESDLAIAEVLHGDLFDQPLHAGWFDQLLSGYGRRPDPFVMGFFRAYHLANLGFFSALVGDAEHAAVVLAALRLEVEALDGG